MSLDLSATKFEVRDDAGRLIVDHATKLIPIVQTAKLTNVDVAFPDVSRAVNEIEHHGTTSGATVAPDGRAWIAQAWGLMINAGIQQGAVNLLAITPGVSPNLILANINAYRSVTPNEAIFGPFTKSMPENAWLPVRSGARLEFNAWCRRIVWLDISGGFLRLNWKQSTKLYNPNRLDPNKVFWDEKWVTLAKPPAYQIGSSYKKSPPGEAYWPDPAPKPSINSGPAGVFSFASTWRFSNINVWLGQI